MRVKLLVLAALFVLLGFGACTNISLPEVDRRLVYTVRVHPNPQNGDVRLSGYNAARDTYITIYANPRPGYVLQTVILRNESEASNASRVNVSTPVYSTVVNSNMAISADFAANTDAARYTISIDPSISGGIMYPERYERVLANPSDPNSAMIEPGPTMSEAAGTQIKITILPEPGLDIAGGSLKVRGVQTGAEFPISPAMPYIFTMPAENVMIEAEFDHLAPHDLKDRAWAYLGVGQYDTAAELYEAAWQLDRNDPDLILYSTLGLLGKIITDYDVRAILGYGSLYFSPVPGTIDDWVCDNVYWKGNNKWYKAYAATVYTPKDAHLPQFYNRFSGYIKPFGDSPIAQQPGRDHLQMFDNRDTREKFSNYIFWALISSYRSGFNPFVEKINRYIFGKKFDEALARAATLPDNARVPLNPRLKDRFALDTIYGGPSDADDTYIGKPELDYIFGNLLAVKALFEYISAYDLTIDLRNWLMDYVYWDHGLQEILDQMFSLQKNNPGHQKLWKDPSTLIKMLPLKNNFLRIRDARGISKSKATIGRALAMTNSAMDYWYGSSGNTSRFIPSARDERIWARQAWAQAKDAMAGGSNGIFYFTTWLPRSESGSSWPNADSGEFHPDTYDGVLVGDTDGGGNFIGDPLEVRRNKIYGVNVSKFFTPGAFTLTNLFSTEMGGTAPRMFRIEWYENRDNSYIPEYTGNYFPVSGPIEDGAVRENDVAGTGYSAPFRKYSFEVNTNYLKELFPRGFGDLGDANGGKELVYKVFPSIPLWPWAETYFKGNRPASELYWFYHKTTVE